MLSNVLSGLWLSECQISVEIGHAYIEQLEKLSVSEGKVHIFY